MKENTLGGREDRTIGGWQDWVNLMLGVWLFIAPYVGVGARNDIAAWNSYAAGAAVVILAIAALSRWRVWEEWVNLVIGLWLVLAPFVLGFTHQPAPMWNQIIVGLLIGAGALWAAVQFSPRGMHHA